MTLYYYIMKKPAEEVGTFMAEFTPPIVIHDLKKLDEIKSEVLAHLERKRKVYTVKTTVDEYGWEITEIEIETEGR